MSQLPLNSAPVSAGARESMMPGTADARGLRNRVHTSAQLAGHEREVLRGRARPRIGFANETPARRSLRARPGVIA